MKRISAILSIPFFAFTTCSPKARVTTLDGFLQRYSQEFLKGSPYKVAIKDYANGYLGLTDCNVPNECIQTNYVDIAMWKTTSGDIMWGAYQYGCSGGGCWGGLDSLRFFDTTMGDITTKVYDADEIRTLAKQTQLFAGGMPVEQDRNFLVNIPRFGTTITLDMGVMFVAGKRDFAELQFDKTSGKFRLVAK